MFLAPALVSGVVGASALTLIHETVRRGVPETPRMDLLGMRAIAEVTRHLDREPPTAEGLHKLALVGDIVSNALTYSLVGLGSSENAPRNGALLGLAAGIGGVLLPEPLGLGSAPSARTPSTRAMTLGWYAAGGVVAGVTYRYLADRYLAE